MRQFTKLMLSSVAVVFLVAASANGASVGDVTCTGGSIASGVYSNLNIAGPCSLNAGSVTVEHKLTVLPGGILLAAFGGSDITVGDNVDVQANGVLIMGCEPIFFICLNDPDQKIGTFSTTDTVGGTLTAENALAVIVHHSAVGHNVVLSGGGGGVSCASSPALGGAPPFGDFEDNTIGGNLTITGWHSCWLGALRNLVRQNINFHGNLTADPDGNEIANNSIGRNLNCTGNSPSPQIGDSGGGPNTVFGRANGQCANPTLVR
jgi:hypothetical protein